MAGCAITTIEFQRSNKKHSSCGSYWLAPSKSIGLKLEKKSPTVIFVSRCKLNGQSQCWRRVILLATWPGSTAALTLPTWPFHSAAASSTHHQPPTSSWSSARTEYGAWSLLLPHSISHYFAHRLAMAASHPPPPPPGPSPPSIPSILGFTECRLCAMTLTGPASCAEHVRGKEHRRLEAAAAVLSSASAAHPWACTLCALHNDTAKSLFSHVGGHRHRRAVERLRSAGRIHENAPLMPRLRAALDEVPRTGEEDEHFAGLLAAAEAEAADAGESGNDSDSSAPREDGADGETDERDAEQAPSSWVATTATEDGRRASPLGAGAGRACLARASAGRQHNGGRRLVDCPSRAPAVVTSSRSRKRRLEDGAASGSGHVAAADGEETGWSIACRTQSSGRGRPANDVSGGMTVVVPPGANVRFECPRCERLYDTASAFARHTCSPASSS